MMRKIAIILVLTAFLASLTSCTREKESSRQPAQHYSDYVDIDARIAVQAGDVYGDVAKRVFDADDAPEYPTIPDMLEAVRTNRADAALVSHDYVRQLTDSGAYPDFEYLWLPKEEYVHNAGFVFHTEELRDQYNEWFATIKNDGTWDEVVNRWIGVSLPEQEDIPTFEFTGENGVLRVCDTGSYPPMVYYDANNQPVGYDVEMVSRFAIHMGMVPEFTMMAYEAIGPYVTSGKADMSSAALTITDEREDGMIFGEPSVITQAVLVVPKSGEDVLDYTDFADKDVAVITGVLTYDTTEKIGGRPVNYNDSSSAAEDVRQGRVAGYMHALTAIQVMASQLDGFAAVPVPTEIFSAQIGGVSNEQAVIDRFNTFLSSIEDDGTLADMKERWFGDGVDLNAPIPDIPNPGDNGVLNVAVCSDSIPYVFVGEDGDYSGFSTELALRFGAYEGKTVEFTDMAFDGLIPYVVSGKADIGLANMAITEERKKSVLFSEPFFDEQHGILALSQGAVPVPDYADFFGKTIGLPTGYILDVIIEEDFDGTPAYYSETSAGIEDVRQERIAGFMTDLSVARVVCNEPGNEDLVAVPVPDSLFSGPLGAIAAEQPIVDRFNAFLTKLKDDGALADIQRYWLEDNPGSDPPMPDIPLTGENGVLKAAVGAASIPFTYLGEDGELKGFCIELMRRFAAHEGLSLEIASMEFGALIPYVSSGKADIGIDAITITEERKKSVLFTDPFYDDQAGIIALPTAGEAPTESGGGFVEWLKTGVHRNLITDNRWKMILDGLGVTLVISLLAQLFGTLLGCFVCFLLMRKNVFAKGVGSFYCGLIHGTPIVVLLMITYYIIFGDTSVSNVLVAVAAFTMVTGAGVAGTLKGAIETVDPLEVEAARSIGFTAFRAFLSVTLPQAVRRAMPSYTNEFVELVKATAIVGYIAIQDLTRAGDIIRSRTYDAYFPLLFVAVIYLFVTTVCVWLFKYTIKKINKGGVAK